MANHAEVKTRRKLDAEILLRLLNEINEEHFGGKIIIKDEDECYIIEVNEFLVRSIWVNDKKNVELRHGGGTDLLWWVDFVLMNELAVKLNGVHYDDGIGKIGKGEHGKYPTFRSYMDAISAHADGWIREYRIYREMKDALVQAPHLADFMGEKVPMTNEKAKEIDESMKKQMAKMLGDKFIIAPEADHGKN